MSRPPRPALVGAGLLGFTVLLFALLLTGDESIPESGGTGRPDRRPGAAPAGRPGARPGDRAASRASARRCRASCRRPATSGSGVDGPGLRKSDRSLLVRDRAGGSKRHDPLPVLPRPGASNGDWEDIAYTKAPDGRGRLWISDNVNRHTAPKVFWEVAGARSRPGPGGHRLGRYRWAYPDFARRQLRHRDRLLRRRQADRGVEDRAQPASTASKRRSIRRSSTTRCWWPPCRPG